MKTTEKTTRVLTAIAFAACLAVSAGAHAAQGDDQSRFDHDDYHGHVARQDNREEHKRFTMRDEDRRAVHDYMAHHHYRCGHGNCGRSAFYQRGAYLPREVVYQPLPREVVVGLAPPPPGTEYVRVGDNAYLLDQNSREILDGISLNVNIH